MLLLTRAPKCFITDYKLFVVYALGKNEVPISIFLRLIQSVQPSRQQNSIQGVDDPFSVEVLFMPDAFMTSRLILSVIIIIIIGQPYVVCRSWAKASACRLQVSLSCAVLCQIVSLQYLSRSSLGPSLGWSPLLYVLCILCLQVVTHTYVRSIGRHWDTVYVPCPVPLHFSHIADSV